MSLLIFWSSSRHSVDCSNAIWQGRLSNWVRYGVGAARHNPLGARVHQFVVRSKYAQSQWSLLSIAKVLCARTMVSVGHLGWVDLTLYWLARYNIVIHLLTLDQVDGSSDDSIDTFEQVGV